ncbi:MAG: ATP-binding protein, partial [Acidimicrobiales bacterium]
MALTTWLLRPNSFTWKLGRHPYERRALGVGSHFGFDKWGHFLPEHTTAASLLDRLIHHATVVV